MAVIDLSQLPAPQIVDVPDFETLLAERKAEFVALHPKDEQEAVIRTLELESEPSTKSLQEDAYLHLISRQFINQPPPPG
ncbi:baseplate assembly protein, partial [Escherichia coli]